MLDFGEVLCFACGIEIGEPPRRAASLRCDECMGADVPVSLELVRRARAAAVRARAGYLFDDPAGPVAA